MNKTAQTELHRLFLVERLPEPLTAVSSHLQIFDNYFKNTRMRIREIRDPYLNKWTRILQQRFPVAQGEYSVTKLAEIHLDQGEYALFEQFKGREIRKNRYFHEFDNVLVAFDVYLGNLRGLHTARIDFEDRRRMEEFEPPLFAVFEITHDPFFAGENLVDRTFADIRAEVERIGPSAAVIVTDTGE